MKTARPPSGLPALASGVAVLWLPFLAYAVMAGDERLIRFFPDDAFYYLQSAWNFARTGRSTFDGVHLTNGYHPLNFALVTLLALSSTKSMLLSMVFAVQSALALAGAGLAVGRFGRSLPDLARWGTLVVTASPVLLLFVHLSAGLEAGLTVLCTVVLFAALASAADSQWSSPGRNTVLGVSIALLLLARLDTIIAVAVVLAGLAAAWFASGSGSTVLPRKTSPEGDRRHRPTARWLAGVLPIAAVPCLMLSAYLFANWYFMGHMVPISGHVKGEELAGGHSWHPSTQGSLPGVIITLVPLFVSVVTVVVAAGRLRRRCQPAAETLSMLLGNLGNIAFYAYLAWGVAHVFRWYFAFPIGCAVASTAYLAGLTTGRAGAVIPGGLRGRLHSGRASIAGAGVWLMLGLAANAACLVWIGGRAFSTSYHLKQVSKLVSRWGGERAVTGTLDAGVVGFFSSGRVINLDGLANDFEYLDEFLRKGRVGDYLRREGVTHFLVRDTSLSNLLEVAGGDYRAAVVNLTPGLTFSRELELFRYAIPGQFTVYYFRMPEGASEPEG